MKEYSHGVLLADKRIRRRRPRFEKYATVFVVITIILSFAFLAVMISSLPVNQTPKKAFVKYAPETLDSFGDVGQYSALAIDSLNNIDIIYYNASSGDSKLASWNGFAWNIQIPHLTPNNDGLYCSVASNSTNVKMGTGYDATAGDLYFGNSIGEFYVLDSVDDVGMYSSIDIQIVTNSIAISYYDATNGNLKVAYNKSGNSSWVIYTVDSTDDVGLYTDMLFQPWNDSMSITYYDATNGAMKNAWAWDLGSGLGPWYNMTIDGSGADDAGKWSSQAGKLDGSWYGSWYDVTDQNLRFNYWDAATNDLTQADPDTVGDVGQYTSIGYNSTGNAFISYYDVTNGDLKLAWNVSDQWFNMTLDSVGDVGKFTSLKVDSSDAVHISYYDATNGDLKYVKILPSETPIPEFGEILIPIVGLIATMAILSARRNVKKQK